MSVSSTDLSLHGYQTRLPSFEGPLDVLLHLIERQRLDISDVSLVAVTDQFMEHIAMLDERDPHSIAEFAAVGTRLTALKSRWLLPRPPVTDEESAPDPDDLVEQLRAYQQLKRAAARLGQRIEQGQTSYAPVGTHPVVRMTDAADTKLMMYAPHVLLASVRRRLSAVPKTVQAIRARRVISIREMTDRILAAVQGTRRTSFRTITAESHSRTDVATAFLAVLVLVRRQIIDAEQTTLFGDIVLEQGTTENQEPMLDMESDFVS